MLMEIRKFKEEDVSKLVSIWNSDVVESSIYAPFTVESFKQTFMRNPNYDPEGSLTITLAGEPIGYGNAMINKKDENIEETPGFITCVFIKNEHQKNGYGSLVLRSLEDYLKDKGKKFIRLMFYNPVNFKWLIPNEDAYHGGAPAIPYNSKYYFLFMNNRYTNNGQLDGYFLDLQSYELSSKVVEQIEKNKADGYNITMYDPKKHYGFKELFEALNNPGWQAATDNNLAKKEPKPMLIVEKDGEILGWTGAVYTEDGGRGHFDGVGVHPKVQGRGLGKTLFCYLCYVSKQNGAKFMTLFTGSENPARNLYFYAGFRLVQSFAILRKDL